MDREQLKNLLARTAKGELDPEQALEDLLAGPFSETLAQAEQSGVRLDPHRMARTGMPEVIFGQGKGLDQLQTAAQGLADHGQPVLATRLGPEQGEHLAGLFPQGQWWPEAGLFSLDRDILAELPEDRTAEVAVISAGASDRAVALEALGVCRFFGLKARLAQDAGVAGLHRIREHLPLLNKAALHIVVAGMEGALPSVVSGLCGKPVIAVPTSVGYGASFQGLAALLGMLNSCAPGVAVVNIDNGFGAAVMAFKLLRP